MEQNISQRKVSQIQTSTQSAPIVPLEQKTLPSNNAQEKKLLRTPRTKKYAQLLKKIDTPDEKDNQIMELVKSMPVNNKLLGILSECKIQGCIIHAIDKHGNILAHFNSLNEMSADLQEGYRIFKQHPGCMSVEVYTSSFCIVYDDGTVKFIEREV